MTGEQCAYILMKIADDLDLRDGLSAPWAEPLPDFFTAESPEALEIPGIDHRALFEELLQLDANADTYFRCLAELHKRRLKYARILQSQPIPTLMQVGPRSLLQYGSMSNYALAALLIWRKWFYDIDNRSAQETGYIFEPIVAKSIGGQSFSAKKSPVKRRNDPKGGGRQVDCIQEDRAYEIKLRITIAASGQGRWGEELDFPADCEASHYKPVLIVFDDTTSTKLTEISERFVQHGGEVHIGADAWSHLEGLAGKTMATFLEKYVRKPLDDLLDESPTETSLPPFSVRQTPESILFSLGEETVKVERAQGSELDSDIDSEDEE